MVIPPLISYVTFNRLGLTVQNLTALLATKEDFELRIVDNHSSDGTWEYIQSLADPRILSKTQLEVNHGLIYAINLNLTMRKRDQYFITIDNDVLIETSEFISRFMEVFKAYKEVGLVGVYGGLGPMPTVAVKINQNVPFLEYINSGKDFLHNYIPGYFMCLSPELIEEIGYFSEETYLGNIELSYRVNHHTQFKSGLVPSILIKLPQAIPCTECSYHDQCILNKSNDTCFSSYQKSYQIEAFTRKFMWKFDETITDMISGARPVYCASILDASSMENHVYNKDWALENIRYFVAHAN